MTIDLTKEVIGFLLNALGAISVQGIDTMQRVLVVADKLKKALEPEKGP